MPAIHSFTGFSPTAGPSGSQVILELGGGLPGVEPQSLTCLGGVFIRADESHPVTNVRVFDTQHYALFGITVPNTCTIYQDYEIVLFFESTIIPDWEIDIKTTTPFVVNTGAAYSGPTLGKVTPASVTLAELETQIFTVNGEMLDQLNPEMGIIATPGNYPFKILEHTKNLLRIKPYNYDNPETNKTYRLKGVLKNGERCQTTAFLTINE